MLNIVPNNRFFNDYLDSLQIDFYDIEGLPLSFHNTVKANITFTKKLNDFKQLIDCLSGDLCFKLWVRETEEVLECSEHYLREFSQQYITEQRFIDEYRVLAERILDLTCRIRAETNDAGQLSYDVKSGVFKEICEDAQIEIDAKQNNALAPIEASINNAIDKLITQAKTEEMIFHTKRGAEIKVSSNSAGTLFALTSTGSNITLSIRHIRNYLKKQSDIIVDQKSYEWAIANSLRSEVEYANSIEKVKPYVLIIDEINRGNISRIFGELITLIEDSKRQGADEALSVTLPYSKKEFSVPNNVYIIGTMNSSDRSLTGLDIALRRRFTFIEMPPKPELLNDVVVEGLNIGRLLEVINQRIEVLLDRDHCIGHANFMSLNKQPTREHLAEIFKQKIIPQLQEYFFDDWAKINLVFFNNGMIVEDKEINIAGLFPANIEQDMHYSEQKKIWKIKDEAFKTIDAFISILGLKG